MTEDTYFSMKWPKYEDAGLGTDMLFPGQHLIVPKLLSFFKKLGLLECYKEQTGK